LLNDRRTQCHPDLSRQVNRVLRHRYIFGQCFQNAAHIPNGYSLLQQVLENLLQQGMREKFGNQLLDQFGTGLGHMLQQLVQLLYP